MCPVSSKKKKATPPLTTLNTIPHNVLAPKALMQNLHTTALKKSDETGAAGDLLQPKLKDMDQGY